MFEGSLRKARERTLEAASGYLESGEEIQLVAMAMERWRIRWVVVAIAAIASFPVLFAMNLNGVSGLLRQVTLGAVIGVVLWGRTGAIDEAPRAHRPTVTGARIDVDGATPGG